MPSYLHFETIDSTSVYLMDRVSSLQDRTFVSSDFQSKGKGRLSRVWESKPGENLLFSFLLKDPRLLSRYGDVSLLAGECVAEAFALFGAKDVSIKWPNDVYIAGKKAAGILLEGSSIGDELQAVVVGIGVNLNQTRFGDGIQATSLSLETKRPVDVNSFRETLFGILNASLDRLQEGDRSFLKDVQTKDFLKGKDITFEQDGPHQGHCLGIDEDGSLLLEENGKILRLRSGEANLVRAK